MKPWFFLIPAFALAGPVQAADCNALQADAVIAQPLPGKPDYEIDVSVQESVEGGVWEVYIGAGGKPERIVRRDFGESGRTEHTLAAADGGAFVIRKTYFRYNVPSYVEGSAVVREETDYFRFCGKGLLLPEGWESDEGYLTAARAASAQFFSSPEIARDLQKAGLRPPLWK